MKRGWGYDNSAAGGRTRDAGKLLQGRNAYGVWISFRDRDPLKAAMIVCGALIGGALLLAAVISIGGGH